VVADLAEGHQLQLELRQRGLQRKYTRRMPMPGWNSLQAVSKLHTIFEVGGIFVLAALVICEGLAFSYGRRKDTLSVEASRPRVEASEVFRNKQLPDGRFLTNVLVKVIAPFPVQLLTAEVRGVSIVDMKLLPNRAGTSSGTFMPGGPGIFVRTLQSPFSENKLEIWSQTPESFQIEYKIE
jgi:hypothetical protein